MNFKLILITILLLSKSLIGQNEIKCSEAFQAKVITELDIIDKGDFDKSYSDRVESEDFRKFIYNKVINRDRNQGSDGGEFGIGPFKIKIPSFSNKSDKEITEDIINEFKSIKKSESVQIDKKSWLKKIALKFLPADARRDILASWDKCNSGLITLEKHKLNVKISLTKINSETKIEKANIERFTKLDYYTHLENIERLYYDDKISERTYKLEIERTKAKKRGLIYYIDESDNDEIDIVMEWDTPIGNLGKIQITNIIAKGVTYDNKILFIGMSFDRDKTINFTKKKGAKKMSILIETNYEVTVRYKKTLEETLTVNQNIQTIKYLYDGSAEKKENGILLEKGFFKNGKLNGYGAKYYDGNENVHGLEVRIVGEYKNGILTGIGKKYNDDRLIEEGSFRNGLLNGNGIIFNSIDRENRIVGEFQNGILNGNAKFYLNYSDRIVEIDGFFENGNLVKGKKYFQFNGKIWMEGLFKGQGYQSNNYMYEGKLYEYDSTFNELRSIKTGGFVIVGKNYSCDCPRFEFIEN